MALNLMSTRGSRGTWQSVDMPTALKGSPGNFHPMEIQTRLASPRPATKPPLEPGPGPRAVFDPGAAEPEYDRGLYRAVDKR